MDTRRLLTVSAAAGLLSACASLGATGDASLDGLESPMGPVVLEPPTLVAVLPSLPETARPYLRDADLPSEVMTPTVVVAPEPAPAPRTGRAAIARANSDARAPSRSDQFVGGVQVFAWAPGRVYEIWTAPLRVTTLTLAPGETIVSKAAGDTIRWQIGDTTSGTGAAALTHVLLKPLERGLETNLVLTTSHRVYWLDLKSGPADAFNAAVAWDVPASDRSEDVSDAEVAADPGIALPDGLLAARYRIRPQGRAPRWTPTAVFTDGTRTFVTLPPETWADEAPALFVIASDGEAQLTNYRQQGGLLIVDRVFDRAELRSSDRRPRIVRLERQTGDRR